MKRAMSRRKLLKSGGWITAAWLANSSCESLDRLVLGKAPEEETVFVLGAGLAGLAAGIELKKRRIPFLILDRAEQPGGRARTLDSFGASNESLDLGGEWFNSRHSAILHWVKELRLETMRREALWVPSIDSMRKGNPQSWQRSLRRSLMAVPRQMQQGSVEESLGDWIKRWNQDPHVEADLRVWCANRYGASIEEVPASSFVPDFNQFSFCEMKFRRGAGMLVRGLYDRIVGVLPDDHFLFGYELTRIVQRENDFRLEFKTADGDRIFQARRVICALPAGAIARVEGMFEAQGPLPHLKSKDIKMGQLQKSVYFFPSRFWEASLKTSGGMGISGGKLVWESGRRALREPGGGLTSSQLAGGQGSTEESLSVSAFPGATAPSLEHTQNWSQLVGFHGSHFILPLLAHREKYFPNLLTKSGKQWCWAGEHTSASFPGTMEGALRSGADAVLAMTGTAVGT